MQRLNSQRTKALALVLGAAALLTVLSQPAWAEGKKTYFTTEVGANTTLDPGIVFTDGPKLYILGQSFTYTEAASDVRISGPVVVRFGAAFDLGPPMTGPMWGTARREHLDGGVWDCYWVGTRTVFTDTDGIEKVRSTIRETGVGSGTYAGLVARWVVNATNAEAGNPFVGGGYIIETKCGKGKGRPCDCGYCGLKPMLWCAARTESLELHPGVFLPPDGPPVEGVMGTFEILKETGVGLQVGRSKNQGLGVMDPQTGDISGGGCFTTASKDLLYWVATGSADFETGQANLTVHFAGGTGRFEAAVGEMTTTVSPDWKGGPLEFVADYRYCARGAIRY